MRRRGVIKWVLAAASIALLAVLVASLRSNEHSCDRDFQSAGEPHVFIGLDKVTGTDCATGERVMRLVHRWASPDVDYYDLGASHHRLNAGYICDAKVIADTERWDITCRRGDRVVYGHTG